jgi:hypothetical protein
MAEHEPEELPSIEQWRAMSDTDRRAWLESWNAYAGEGYSLIQEIAREFASVYGHLKGLELLGAGVYHGGDYVIGVTHKLVFDCRLLPQRYLGLCVRAAVREIPEDFQVFRDYIWAPENFAHLVDTHADEVRAELGVPDMSREQMLHALCGMEFGQWIETCRRWGSKHTRM